MRYRPNDTQVRDAHSLYLESLAQLGWPGLALGLLMLAVPVVGAVRARRHPLVAGAFGPYAAYIVHTGIDWDWEVPVVTLIALLWGVALIVAGRDRDGSLPAVRIGGAWGSAALIASLASVTVCSLIGLVGNRALTQATNHADDGDFLSAEPLARKAARWAPWSAEAVHQLGRSQARLGKRGEGRAQLRRAARRTPRRLGDPV